MPQGLKRDTPHERSDGGAQASVGRAESRIGELRLDLALSLLRQAGQTWPVAPDAAAPDATPWLQALIDALCDLSSRDALTGLGNRRQFELAISREVDRVARTGESALVLVLDIDHFKRVNDTHGHAAGDVVIQTIARVLQECVRPMDTVARVGGEEFAIILPNCHAAFGLAVAERIRQRVADTQIAVSPLLGLQVTVSVGGAFAPQWVRSSAALWTERADRQLYRAKAEGRNRTCLETPTLSSVSAEEKGLLFALAAPAAAGADDGAAADPNPS